MRYKHLDGIRGLASIFVVLSHISQLYIPYLINGNDNYMHSKIERIFIEFPFSLFYSGNSMVYIFMIIGGFVTATSCLNDKKILFIKKVFMRYIRLVIPIFITTLLVCFILNTTGFSYNNFDNYTLNSGIIVTKEKMSIFTAIKYSFFDIFVYENLFSGSVLSYNAVLWTIRVEFLCSIIIYIIYRLIKNNSYFRITLIIIIMCVLPVNSKLFYYSFFIGAIIAELFYNNDKKTCKAYLILYKPIYTVLGLLSLYLLGYPYVNKSISYKIFNNIVINEIIDKINGSITNFVG